MDQETRSRMMSGIRGKNTRPERLVRSHLWNRRYRFRLHVKELPGKPDLVLPKWNTVIQIQGCFWHGHSRCRYFKRPGSRKAFWRAKIDANRARDRKSLRALSRLGWHWIVVWECALKDDPERALRLLRREIGVKRFNAEIRSVSGISKVIRRARPARYSRER